MSKGYVYILTNEYMPDIVKIGMTTRNPEGRASELYQTGVPVPFVIHSSFYTPDCVELERLSHEKFAEFRVSDSREFFRILPKDAADKVHDLHLEQVRDFVYDFCPDYTLEYTDITVDPAYFNILGASVGVTGIDIADCIRFIEPEEIQPALDRNKEHSQRMRAKDASCSVAELRVVQ